MSSPDNNKYKVLFEESSDAMLIIEEEEFVDCNQATLNMLGYTKREELFSTHPSELSPEFQPDGQPSFDKANEMISMAREQGGNRFEWIHTRANGDNFPVEVLLTCIPFENRDLLHVVWRDITERKRAQKALQETLDQLEMRVEERTRELSEEMLERKRAEEDAVRANRAKSDLMANMSHELRTPLNAIIGFSETMKEEMFGSVGSDKNREYLDDIHQSGQHLLGLINDILDVSAIEASALELHEENVCLVEAIDTSIRLIMPRAESGQVNVTSSIDPKIPMIYADERRVKQALLNLLSNAVKFTRQEGTVCVSALHNDDGSLAITVADNGIGMDAEELKMAMSKFGQVDSGLERKHEGTGLGLPLTKGLVELHGGDLDINSEKGHGTMITVTFPKERVVEATS